MPNKENLRKWAEALESGDFTQGAGVLHNRYDKFCCLGVACKVAIDNGVPLKTQIGANGATMYDDETAYLPTRVRDWLGVVSMDPTLNAGEEQEFTFTATYLNDSESASFGEIAAAIRRTFELPPAPNQESEEADDDTE